MNDLQKKINYICEEFRFKSSYPEYPPYHKGLYLEEYFYKYYTENLIDTNYYYLPIFWTFCYNEQKDKNIQNVLNKLDPQYIYFTVSQHDDAIKEKHNLKIINFAAGGRNGGVPIPLIASPIPKPQKEINKTILCSFVGTYSAAQGIIRNKLYEIYHKDSDFYFSKPTLWSPIIKNEQINEFIHITNASEFTLCPRGYGLQSFRFYESIQLNSIPIFVYNQEWFPFSDIIDWDSFCIRIHEKDIHNIKKIIKTKTKEDKEKMLINAKNIYEKFFTIESTTKTIIKKLKNEI